jgi:uncharacterized protein YejL (UPF0352 family)
MLPHIEEWLNRHENTIRVYSLIGEVEAVTMVSLSEAQRQQLAGVFATALFDTAANARDSVRDPIKRALGIH